MKQIFIALALLLSGLSTYAVAEQCGNDYCIQGWACKQSRCLPNDPCWFPPHCVPVQRQPWNVEELAQDGQSAQDPLERYYYCQPRFVACQNAGGEFYECQAAYFRCMNGN